MVSDWFVSRYLWAVAREHHRGCFGRRRDFMVEADAMKFVNYFNLPAYPHAHGKRLEQIRLTYCARQLVELEEEARCLTLVDRN